MNCKEYGKCMVGLIYLVLGFVCLTLTTGCVTDENGKRRLAVFQSSTNEANVVEYNLNPQIQKGIDAAAQLNTYNPTPFAPLVNMGLTAIAAALGIWGSAKSRKANRKDLALSTVIRGVEVGTQDGTIKKAIQVAALAAGVAEEVHAAVKNATGK